jgi:hypothetical protein
VVKNIISVFIGSKNPTKINAVKKAFTSVFKKKHFSFVSVSSPSGVGDQPMSERETKRGAENRLFYLKEKCFFLKTEVKAFFTAFIFVGFFDPIKTEIIFLTMFLLGSFCMLKFLFFR